MVDNLFGQDIEKYNQIYNKTYLETSQKDFNRALMIADSLYGISKTAKLQAKSLMLSATLQQQSGNITSAVNYALKAEQIVKEADEYIWQAKIYGFLASQYRILGLNTQSKKYIDLSEETITKIESLAVRNNMLGFIMQEKAYYGIEMKQYSQALQSVKISQKYFDLASNNEVFLSANNKQLEGLCHLKLKNYDLSLESYKSAESLIEIMPDNFLKGLIFSGIAQVYIETKKFEDAKKYLDRADLIGKQSNFLNLKNEINNSWQQYYLATKNLSKIIQTKKKQDSTAQKIADSTSSFINGEYTKLMTKNVSEENKSLGKTSIIIILAFCTASLSIFFTIFYKRNKNKVNSLHNHLENTRRNYTDMQSIIIKNHLEKKQNRELVKEYDINKVDHFNNILPPQSSEIVEGTNEPSPMMT
ncbi:hypothetical protein AB4Y90_12115, partial [Chryseobacterium sp. 2TAF14]